MQAQTRLRVEDYWMNIFMKFWWNFDEVTSSPEVRESGEGAASEVKQVRRFGTRS